VYTAPLKSLIVPAYTFPGLTATLTLNLSRDSSACAGDEPPRRRSPRTCRSTEVGQRSLRSKRRCDAPGGARSRRNIPPLLKKSPRLKDPAIKHFFLPLFVKKFFCAALFIPFSIHRVLTTNFHDARLPPTLTNERVADSPPPRPILSGLVQLRTVKRNEKRLQQSLTELQHHLSEERARVAELRAQLTGRSERGVGKVPSGRSRLSDLSGDGAGSADPDPSPPPHPLQAGFDAMKSTFDQLAAAGRPDKVLGGHPAAAAGGGVTRVSAWAAAVTICLRSRARSPLACLEVTAGPARSSP